MDEQPAGEREQQPARNARGDERLFSSFFRETLFLVVLLKNKKGKRNDSMATRRATSRGLAPQLGVEMKDGPDNSQAPRECRELRGIQQRQDTQDGGQPTAPQTFQHNPVPFSKGAYHFENKKKVSMATRRATSRGPAFVPCGRDSRPRKLTDRAWLEIERAAKVAETHGVTIDLWHHGLEHIQVPAI
jgi:hypothetical protein